VRVAAVQGHTSGNKKEENAKTAYFQKASTPSDHVITKIPLYGRLCSMAPNEPIVLLQNVEEIYPTLRESPTVILTVDVTKVVTCNAEPPAIQIRA